MSQTFMNKFRPNSGWVLSLHSQGQDQDQLTIGGFKFRARPRLKNLKSKLLIFRADSELFQS